MKYLLLTFAAMALVGSAGADLQKANCCATGEMLPRRLLREIALERSRRRQPAGA